MRAELASLNWDRTGKRRPSQLDLTSAICSPQGPLGGSSVRVALNLFGLVKGVQLSQRARMLAL